MRGPTKKMRLGLLGLMPIITAVILLLALPALAVDTWKPCNQLTISWGPVRTLSDGSALPEGQTIAYKLYARADGDAPAVALSTVTAPPATITFSTEGKYILGVSTVRMAGQEVLSESVIVWSDDPAACADSKTFGAQYYLPPVTVGNLKLP